MCDLATVPEAHAYLMPPAPKPRRYSGSVLARCFRKEDKKSIAFYKKVDILSKIRLSGVAEQDYT